MNDFAGVMGAPDPAAALRGMGVPPLWSDARVAFGGAPVWSDVEGQVIVAGELVLDNAAELRARFEMPGAGPGTLVAELYNRYGDDFPRHALGMYAVAVWDAERGRLLLARDGAGARTLYHARQGPVWYFAARLRALRRSPAVSSELSLPALRAYLTYAYVPGALTLWRDAAELRPGHTLSLPEGEARRYWEPVESIPDEPEPLEAYAGRLRPLLEEAVRVRLPESGPVGVFLSGGLDSSLVTALAARMAPGPVHTYSIHFGEPYANELRYSEQVARHCSTRHRVLELPARRIQEQLPATLAALDDPIGDPLTVPNYLLGAEAARDLEVVLNGEGGDPCFGGPKNLPMLLHSLYGGGECHAAAYLRAYQKCYDDLPVLLSPEVHGALAGFPSQESGVQPILEDPRVSRYLNRLMRLNVEFKGADHILTKVSNLTAVHGLLGRSPLSDRRIIDAAFAIPPEYKLSGAEEKVVLKQAVADLLPAEILRRPKSGMLVPVQAWFRRDMRRFARGMLLGRKARTRPYLNEAVVRDWLDYRGGYLPRFGVKLWLLLTLEVWLRAQE